MTFEEFQKRVIDNSMMIEPTPERYEVKMIDVENNRIVVENNLSMDMLNQAGVQNYRTT